jgi:hypothetical protein
MPANTTYVGRPTVWGNHARIDEPTAWWLEADGRRTRIDRVLTRAEAVLQYRRAWGEGWDPDGWDHFCGLARTQLAGRDLACWCPLPEPAQRDWCHAAVLLVIANPIGVAA